MTAATSGWLEQWERPFVIEAQEFVEEGERLAVVVRWKGTSRGGGATIESENTHVWEFREGKAVRFDVYRDRGQALAALREPGDDLEKLRGLYADWARGDFSRTDIFDPTVEMRGYGWPEAMEAHGLEQLGEVMGGWFEPWQHPAVVEADEFIVQRGRIAVLIRWRGRGKESGTPMESEGAHLWRFRDGRAVHYEVYRDREQALAALRESGDGDH